MTATLFLGFVALMAVAVVATTAHYVGGRAGSGLGVALAGWLTYVGLLGYCGVTADTATRPPGLAFTGFPVALFLAVVIVRPATFRRAAVAVPLWLLLGGQSFRVVVELFLYRMWVEGVVPRMLTFDGANVDVYVGASAPLIAWWSARRPGNRLAVAWNVLGLTALANVVVRSVLTTPGPLHLIHAEVPNRMMGTFPFVFLPGFLVPLAVVLHVLAIRAGNLPPGEAGGVRPS